MEYLKLGASLYVPATHKDLVNVAKGNKYPSLKSLIVDMEDAVDAGDLPYAYHNVQKLLNALGPDAPRPLLFVRPRDVGEFAVLAGLPGIERVDGFVLPKFGTKNMREYLRQLPPGKQCMPILEKDVFDFREVEKIRDFLLPYKDRVLSVRIGANDLLGSLNLRRDCRTVIYDIGMLQSLISYVVLCFSQHGINVTGPVYEAFGAQYKATLQREVKLDLLNGLFGKSIIHPWQIDVVQDMYKVGREDHEAARKLIDPYAPAVFKLHNLMHEKATHLGWAQAICKRAELYGIREEAQH